MKLLDLALSKLTDNYNKKLNSNIGKLFRVITNQLEEVKANISKIENQRDIDKAEGKTLDLVGKNVMEFRNGKNDVDYRKFIKTKIIANLSQGDVEVFNQVLEVLIGDSYIGVREVWNDPTYNHEPCALAIRIKGLKSLVEDEYAEYVNNPTYINGDFNLDGGKNLDGGYKYSYEDYKADILNSMINIKTATERIKASGVRLYWEVPEEENIETKINIGNDFIQKIKQNNSIDIDITNDVKHYDTISLKQTPKTTLDGSFYMDGNCSLDGKRDFVLHTVRVKEVS